MIPVSFGITGVFVQLGVVQPQEGLTLSTTKGFLPVFVNLNVCLTLVPSSILPNSCFSESKEPKIQKGDE